MAKRKQKYPKVLYVVRESERNSDETYLVPYDDPAGAAEIFKDVEAAVYELKKVVTVKTNTEVV